MSTLPSPSLSGQPRTPFSPGGWESHWSSRSQRSSLSESGQPLMALGPPGVLSQSSWESTGPSRSESASNSAQRSKGPGSPGSFVRPESCMQRLPAACRHREARRSTARRRPRSAIRCSSAPGSAGFHGIARHTARNWDLTVSLRLPGRCGYTSNQTVESCRSLGESGPGARRVGTRATPIPPEQPDSWNSPRGGHPAQWRRRSSLKGPWSGGSTPPSSLICSESW